MRVIIGYGNSIRGEDGFGVEVITKLQHNISKNIKLIEAYQLTPELCLELLEADEIIFVDAAFSEDNHYKLACIIETENQTNISHHISPYVIVSLLNNVYNKFPKIEIFSMLTNSFDKIENKSSYEQCIQIIVEFL